MRRILIACAAAYLVAALVAGRSQSVARQTAVSRAAQVFRVEPHHAYLRSNVGSAYRHKSRKGPHQRGHAPKRGKPKSPPEASTAQVLLGNARIEHAVDKRHAGVAEAFSFTGRSAGVANSIHIYIGSHNRATTLLVGVYSSYGGHPRSRIASGALSLPKGGGWNTVPVTSAAISAGRTYWLVVLGRGGALYIRDLMHGRCASELSRHGYLKSLPQRWRPAANRRRCPISAYVTGAPVHTTYSPAGSVTPLNVTAPQVTGATIAGDVLTATVGTWLNAPTGYRYQWARCSAAGQDCANVMTATGTSYPLTPADVGVTIAVSVTATNGAGSRTASSIATGLVGPAGTRVFYLSYSYGSDANSGTSKRAPWQHAPGMNGCVAACAAYSHAAGDRFVFQGGDIWPNSSFPLAARGGSAASPDYYGVETDWYVGASFAPPIFNAGGANITGSDAHGSGGGQDIFMDLRGADNVTVDDIAFDNFTASGLTGAYGSCAAIEMVGDQNITINRISIPNMAATSAGPGCFGVQAATAAPNGGNSIVENSVISGALNSYATGILCVGNVENNTIDRMIGEVYPCGHGTISGNLLENCGNPFPAGSSGIHADAIQSDNANGTYYIHDNVIHDTGADQSAPNECESMLIGNPGETDYVWNNVLYNINGNPISLTQNSSPGVAAYIWNNSIEGGFAGSAYCVRSGHPATWTTIAIQNNFCASTASAPTDPGLSAGSMTVNHNILLTPSRASADGYAMPGAPFVWLPPQGASPTAGAGTNLSAVCSALASMCSATTYAGARVAAGRPATGPWTVGAY